MAKSGDLVRRLRVFLASPGDVNEERALVYDVVEKLRYERSIASVATVDVVAWDDPAGGVPLLANETPQQTIDNALVSPADCDIVVVVLWNRLGTPMPSDHPAAAMDRPPRSGTEYEFRLAADAANVNGRPKILVYRRTQGLYLPPQISRDERDALLRQVDLVVDFFESLGPEGGSHRGFNTYERPDDFQRIVEAHLRTLLHELVGELDPTTSSTSHIERGELWEGSPFPGLRSFTPADRPIFFGRGRETSQIVDRLRSSPFLAVVGASGSGKSSLVGAGLLPRLASGVLGDDRKWMVPDFDRSVHRWNGLRVTPAEIGPDPFAALAVQLAPLVGESPRAITDELRSGPARLTAMVERALVQSHHDVAVLFVDQFEELFTLVEPSAVTPYVDSIAHLVESGFGVVVLTMRSDFYQQCLELPTLAHLFERGQFPLPAATDALYEIVARPAERAGLVFDEGLIDRILADTGHDPNALPLLAFALDELYRRSTGGRLTFENYEWLGGVAGAIAMRADQVFQTMLSDLTDIDVAHIFKSLLEVDEGGRVVRRRAPRSSVAADERSDRFVKAFVDARLLVQSRSEIEAEPTVFVAHEALFSSWTRLSQWIATAADDLRLLGKLELAVSDWEEHHRADSYLWPHERLEPVYTMIARLEPDLSDAMRTFIRPEYERVIESFRSEDRETYGRLTDADRLLAIGPLAIPAVKDCLSSDDTAVRDAAANLIWRFGGPAVEPLVDGFDACGAEERLARLTALVRIGDRRALPMIVRAATDADRRVQSVAIGALETLGGDDGRRALESIATSGDTDARWRAAGALGAFGEAAVPSLVQALRDPDANVQHRAGEAILAVGAAAATALSALLDDEDASLAWTAGNLLVELGPDVTSAVEQRLTELDVNGIELGLSVLRAVGGSGGGDVVARLAVDHADAQVRALAVEACVRMATQPCIDATIAAFDDADPWVRAVAAREAPGAGERMVAPLGSLLHTGSSVRARSLAATTLIGLGQTGVTVLTSELEAGDECGAVRAALALTRGGRSAVGPLVAAASSAHDHVAHAATQALAVLGPLVSAEADSLLAADEPRARAAAARILREIAPGRSLRKLVGLLADDDADVRRAAACSITRLGADAVPALTRLTMSGDDTSRDEAEKVLRAIGTPATSALVSSAERLDPDERGPIVRVLGQSTDPRALLAAVALGGAEFLRERSRRL